MQQNAEDPKNVKWNVTYSLVFPQKLRLNMESLEKLKNRLREFSDFLAFCIGYSESAETPFLRIWSRAPTREMVIVLKCAETTNMMW